METIAAAAVTNHHLDETIYRESPAAPRPQGPDSCPDCGTPTVRSSACRHCPACGWGKCG